MAGNDGLGGNSSGNLVQDFEESFQVRTGFTNFCCFECIFEPHPLYLNLVRAVVSNSS